MEQLEKLTQDEFGLMYRANGEQAHPYYVVPKGKLKTLVVANPSWNISYVIDEMAQKSSVFIPEGANSYVASDFNEDTRHLRKEGSGKEKMVSVYAIQFYYLPKLLSHLFPSPTKGNLRGEPRRLLS